MIAANRKVRVKAADSPSSERFVALTTARLLSTDLFVVGVVDGTGRLREPTSLRVTPVLNAARKHANTLVERSGGVVEPDHGEFVHRNQARSVERRGPLTGTQIEAVGRRRNGDYGVRWRIAGQRKRQGKRFSTKREAQAFHAQLIREMGND